MERIIDVGAIECTGLQETHFVLFCVLFAMLFYGIDRRVLLRDRYCLRSALLPINKHTMSYDAKFFNSFTHFSRFSNELARVMS